jgi:hypothetical protein
LPTQTDRQNTTPKAPTPIGRLIVKELSSTALPPPKSRAFYSRKTGCQQQNRNFFAGRPLHHAGTAFADISTDARSGAIRRRLPLPWIG